MKKLIFTCALLSGMSIVSFGQDAKPNNAPPGNPAALQTQPNMPPPQRNAMPPQMNIEPMAERRARMNEQRFKLTPEQFKAAREAEITYLQEMQQYRASGQMPTQGQRENMEIVKDQKYKALLNAEQFAKYDAERSHERMQPMTPTNMPRPAAPPPPAPKPQETK